MRDTWPFFTLCCSEPCYKTLVNAPLRRLMFANADHIASMLSVHKTRAIVLAWTFLLWTSIRTAPTQCSLDVTFSKRSL
jgi:hypothetical protein